MTNYTLENIQPLIECINSDKQICDSNVLLKMLNNDELFYTFGCYGRSIGAGEMKFGNYLDIKYPFGYCAGDMYCEIYPDGVTFYGAKANDIAKMLFVLAPAQRCSKI